MVPLLDVDCSGVVHLSSHHCQYLAITQPVLLGPFHFTDMHPASIIALYCTKLHCTAPQCTTMHVTAFHSSELNCTAHHCTVNQCASLQYTALHPTPPPCTEFDEMSSTLLNVLQSMYMYTAQPCFSSSF